MKKEIIRQINSSGMRAHYLRPSISVHTMSVENDILAASNINAKVPTLPAQPSGWGEESGETEL
jgi:hypothetical protein